MSNPSEVSSKPKPKPEREPQAEREEAQPPTSAPSVKPTQPPTSAPSAASGAPTNAPSVEPTQPPTSAPSAASGAPTNAPSGAPTNACDPICGGGSVCIIHTCLLTGPLRFTLTWEVNGDVDMWVLPPGCTNAIGYLDTVSCGGTLDADDTSSTGPENIVWVPPEIPPDGIYNVCVNPYDTVEKDQWYTLTVWNYLDKLGEYHHRARRSQFDSCSDTNSYTTDDGEVGGGSPDYQFNIAFLGNSVSSFTVAKEPTLLAAIQNFDNAVTTKQSTEWVGFGLAGLLIFIGALRYFRKNAEQTMKQTTVENMLEENSSDVLLKAKSHMLH